MNYYVGLDNGGTTTKAAIFDAKGKEIATASTATKMLVPQPGFTERDMEEMWEANCLVIREALKKSGAAPADIRCVAMCGHGKGLYLWGKDGRPAYHGIISTDNRAWRYMEAWRKDGTEEKAFQLSCQHVLASQPVALLAWMRDHSPEVLENTQWIFECKDYVRFRLTGEPRAELTDYSGANLVNLHTAQYDPALLALFGLSDCMEKLPPLCGAAEICGEITPEAAEKTGLLAGTRVAGGAFDIDACALAVDVVDEENICMIAGTWSINEYIRPRPVVDGKVMMNSFFCLPGYYLIEECSPTSAGNNEWFVQNLLPELKAELKKTGGNIYQQMDRWTDSIPVQEQCPIFFPFLMASNVHPNAMGSFVGMSNFHTRAHLARSVYEGIAFSHRYHLEKLLATRDQAPRGIRLAGGVARSQVWTQMFADVMKLPVEVVQVNETGALGCAVIGAAASGEYASLADAAAHMCRISQPIMPDQIRSRLYDEKYELYLQAIQALDPLWDRLQEYRDRHPQG